MGFLELGRVRALVDESEVAPERRYIWTLYSLQKLLRMYGYDGDQDEVMVACLYHGLASREADHAQGWMPGQAVDFAQYDPYNQASIAYQGRARLCEVEREASLAALYAVGCLQDGRSI